jgi:hypothetical protein
MKKIGVLGWLFAVGFGSALGCSASDASNRPGLTEGDGGSSAQGGNSGSNGATSGTGNHGGTSMIELGGSGGATSGGSGSAPVCNALTATSTLIVPTVLLLVDNSSSMFQQNGSTVTAWSLLYDALMDPKDGVVKSLASQIRFGFTSYKGFTASGEADPSCATMTPSTPSFALENYDAINTVYSMLGSENHDTKWETPTGHAISVVTPALAAFSADPPGPKYILLVTDGNPNTCKTSDPQCGQDRTIAAVQSAKAQGIGTFVIGIGDIVTNPNSGCTAGKMRCGNDHLQDVANAGVGLPVQAPPDDYKYERCIAEEGGTLTAAYAAAGETPGTAEYFATNDAAELSKNLSQVLFGVASCTFDLDAVVTGDPTRSNVTLDGAPLTYGEGWALEMNKYQVTLQGSACDTYRSAPDHVVSIEFLCDEMGMPVAEPR